MDTIKENGAASLPKIERLAYTPMEAATASGVSRETIYRLISKGVIKCAPGLRTKLISKTTLEKFLNGSAA